MCTQFSMRLVLYGTDIIVGGVLYGYNQGVFSSVQVMQRFLYRFPAMVSLAFHTAARSS